jgi:hypothetical protein
VIVIDEDAVFSTGTANNAGAILVLGRDLVVVPKLIHPLPPAITSPESSPEHHLDDTWMQVCASFCMLLELWCSIQDTVLGCTSIVESLESSSYNIKALN